MSGTIAFQTVLYCINCIICVLKNKRKFALFDLRVYDISYTWISQVLDSKISNAVRDWMELQISSCVPEILSLPKSQ